MEKDLGVSVFLAYKHGAFTGIAPGLEKEEFIVKAAEEIMQWSDAVILEVNKPVGLLSVNLLDDHALIDAHWFPWATPRNKVETVLNFILDYKKDFHLLAASSEKPFFDQLFRYGCVRAIGKTLKWGHEPMTLYESV